MGILSACLLTISVATGAEQDGTLSFTQAFPRKAVHCRLGRRAMALVLAGITGKVEAEEKEFGSPYLFVSDKGHASPIVAGGPQLALRFLPKSESQRYCPGTVAFHPRPGVLGFAFLVDDRPMPSQLGVAFYDLHSHKLLGVADRLGAFDQLKVTRRELEFRLTLSVTDAASPVETTVKGQVVVMEEEQLHPWYRVTSDATRVRRSADRERTWKESRWKGYFRSRDVFERAFAYEPATEAYSNLWVYVARIKDQPGEQCILASAERLPKITPQSPWVCSK